MCSSTFSQGKEDVKKERFLGRDQARGRIAIAIFSFGAYYRITSYGRPDARSQSHAQRVLPRAQLAPSGALAPPCLQSGFSLASLAVCGVSKTLWPGSNVSKLSIGKKQYRPGVAEDAQVQ
jgi:hypothetical protein